ncbi:Aspartyl protease family protein 1 [Sesamum angolense]|uniref:Aspartyl protease family protein 1 n=1 Tax=Sesamum angolense TaxID=2727404 RepID=A0AAE2BQB9_9LAMI|nr:Aspartyl protease family protein 1 [Sesamum angolense]
MHHRFSAPVKEWYHRSRTGLLVHNWPEKGSVEYYVLLASHDRTIHRRALSGSDGALTFSEGNSTFRISSLGFLHYTTVTLGTPGMTFLVALDTGSDLFWVPCHSLSSLSSCMMASISLVSLGLTMNGLTAVDLNNNHLHVILLLCKVGCEAACRAYSLYAHITQVLVKMLVIIRQSTGRLYAILWDICRFLIRFSIDNVSRHFYLSLTPADSPFTFQASWSIDRLVSVGHLQANMSLAPMTYAPIMIAATEHLVIALTMCHISSETSTSGILVEDILHLRTLDSDQEFIKAYVTFGCGQVQTGSFLDIAAPNGLFGLGLEKVSVPSTLFREGYMANSFSMCFGHDGTGRINFGDKGSLDQEETPFHTNSFHPTYNVNVTQVRVGTTVLDYEFTALFDSGTSFTYLVDPFYTMLSDSFKSHVRDQQRPPDPRIPFEYCIYYETSLIPGMSLTMDGGGQLLVYDPIIVISSPHELVYCLAVVKSQELNIIGLHCGYWAWWVAEGVNDEEHGQISVDNYAIKNFMTGYRIVFDREKLVLGWKKFDCYNLEDSNASEAKPVNYAKAPPPTVVGLLNHTTQSDVRDTNKARDLAALSLYTYVELWNNFAFGFRDI